MKSKEIQDMSVADLKSKLDELRKELIKQRAQVALGASVKNSKQISAMKKDVARILTVLKQKDGVEE